jgi:MoxR-like ATPase/GNAT superfamily N-acetyltransferase
VNFSHSVSSEVQPHRKGLSRRRDRFGATPEETDVRTSIDAVNPGDEGQERSVCAPHPRTGTWHIRDFAPEDLEAAIRLDTASAMTGQRPLFEVCDLVSSLQERHPTVVAVADGDVVGVAASRIDDDRAWVVRLSLDPRWRDLGMGSALLAELEHRLLTHGVRRITALLPQGETGTAAFLNSGFVPRENIAHFDKHETVSPRSAAILARLGGNIPPARLWDHIAGMSDEKGLIDRRIVLPHSRPEQAAEHGVVPPRAIVLFGPPGTGKTTFARGIASRLAWPFVELFPSQLGTGTGDLATGLNDAFTKFDELENVVVFIDEVEDIAARRRPESRSTTAVVNELLKCIVRFRDRPGRLLVCATNSVRELDPAFLRHGRFDCVIPIGPPDDKARKALWSSAVDPASIDVAALVTATRDFTPADITYVVRAVAQATFERSVDQGSRVSPTTIDYLALIDTTKPTVSAEQVTQHGADIDTYVRL